MTPIRIGLLRLVDSAAVLHAQASGLFARYGLAARISVEPSWANLADKLAWGALDAAVMLPPLALAAALGLRGAPARLIVPMGLTLGGNAIAGGPALAEAVGSGEMGGAAGEPLDAARRLLAWARAQPAPPDFAVVHAWSTHALLMRYWIAAAGGDPERDLRFVAIPPEQVVDALGAGRVAGFCAGAPWGGVAEARGAGRVLLGTSAIWNHHPEKCLAVHQGWAEANPAGLTGLLRALLIAGRECDDPAGAPALVRLLTEAGIAAPEAALRAALPGGSSRGSSRGNGGGGRERIAFHAGAAWFPWHSHAAWFLAEMRRWGWLEGIASAQAAGMRVYRPDLLEPAARAEGLNWPARTEKPEGAHGAAWAVEAEPACLMLEADRFCDGTVFGG